VPGTPGISNHCAADSSKTLAECWDYRGQPGRVAGQSRVCRRHEFSGHQKNEMSIVHQTGERDYDAVRTAYARHEI
jgi:hypothetical protein